MGGYGNQMLAQMKPTRRQQRLEIRLKNALLRVDAKWRRVRRLEKVIQSALDCLERSNPPAGGYTDKVCRQCRRALGIPVKPKQWTGPVWKG
jgi:hypothetical protein